ncbi:MAG: methyltransferase domain-containing protein [Chitinophagaceae bacterium]|nr:methyltransferase domain-containing protein [Chitinophagaceae bacterium]
MFLSSRSYQEELLDNEDIPFEDIRQNMKELNFINTWLGGHRISIAGLKKIWLNAGQPRSLHICEIGCGGGDNLRAIEKWCSRNKLKVILTGIDKKKECIDFAGRQFRDPLYRWVVADYKSVHFEHPVPDVIFSSLFCHHFSEKDLEYMMTWMQRNSRLGFFINDLHRHPLAYYSIKWLTFLFSKSYLVKNDAPLSVSRGFKKEDWEMIMQRAGIQQYSIRWKWAFRWLITAA